MRSIIHILAVLAASMARTMPPITMRTADQRLVAAFVAPVWTTIWPAAQPPTH